MAKRFTPKEKLYFIKLKRRGVPVTTIVKKYGMGKNMLSRWELQLETTGTLEVQKKILTEEQLKLRAAEIEIKELRMKVEILEELVKLEDLEVKKKCRQS